MQVAYRATVTGEPARDFPSAKEAIEYAAGKVYLGDLSPNREHSRLLLLETGKLAWVYGFFDAEIVQIPRSEARF